MEPLLLLAKADIQKSTGKTLTMKDLKHLEIMPVQNLNAAEHRYTLLGVNDVAYAFLGSAFSRKTTETQQQNEPAFRDDRLYIRTIQGAYFRSPCRSLKTLSTSLRPHLFLNIQKALLVNMKNVKEIDFSEKKLALGLAKGSLLWLKIGRRYVKTFRQLLLSPEKAEGGTE